MLNQLKSQLAKGMMLVAMTGGISLTALAVPTVEIETNLGKITVELNKEKAPISVENFLRYTKEGFYKGTIFHRVIPGFMIQGGGFDEKMVQKPTHEAIKNEANNGLKNQRGTIAMARKPDPHSATAQFFINHAENTFLDYPSRDGWGYAVFGKVTKGMEIVDKIASTPTGFAGGMPDVPQTMITIQAVKVISEK